MAAGRAPLGMGVSLLCILAVVFLVVWLVTQAQPPERAPWVARLSLALLLVVLVLMACGVRLELGG